MPESDVINIDETTVGIICSNVTQLLTEAIGMDCSCFPPPVTVDWEILLQVYVAPTLEEPERWIADIRIVKQGSDDTRIGYVLSGVGQSSLDSLSDPCDIRYNEIVDALIPGTQPTNIKMANA
jgi:hypothetical protein